MDEPRLGAVSGPEELREAVRPGLVLRRRREIKPDGRYLLSYEFEREAAPGGAEGEQS